MRAALVTCCFASLAAASPEELRQSPDFMPPPVATVEAPARSGGSVEVRPAVSAAEPDRSDGPRRWGVFAAGVTLFAAGYAADVGVTYGMGHSSPSWSLIPVVGPLIQLGDSFQLADPNAVKTGNAAIDQQSSQMINTGNQAYQSVIYAGLVLDAALQIAGVVTAIAGAASKTRRPPMLTAAGRLSIAF